MNRKLKSEWSNIEEIVSTQKIDISNCLKVFNKFLDAGNKCSKLVDDNHNLVRIFFHDLLRITTSYILKKNALENSLLIPDWAINYQLNKFPYFSYIDVKSEINLEEKRFINKHNDFSKKYKLFNFISNKLNLLLPTRNVIGVTYPLQLDFKSYLRLLKDFNIEFLHHNSLDLVHLNEQFEILNNCLDDLFKSKVPNAELEKIKLIVKNHLQNFIDINTNKIDFKKYNAIIIDSPSETINRINSILAQRNKIPVISFMHGAGDQTMYNEPVMGYIVSSFVDYQIGYGNVSIDSKNSSYLRGFSNSPTFFGASSKIISNTYKSKKIRKINEIYAHKWMYVPDSGQLVKQHGPYSGSINPFLYFKWQNHLIKNFPGINYKKHPKGDPAFRSISDEQLFNLIDINDEEIKLIKDNFSEVYSKCDGFIFDTVSTAFMIAVSTDKPIIYFNIGKREFTKKAKLMIKDRCLWVDIMNGEIIDVASLNKTLSSKNFVNNITKNYSLNDNINSFEDALFSIIKKL